MKAESTYKLRKRVKELELDKRRLEAERYKYKKVVLTIFDKLIALEKNHYYNPRQILAWFRDLL